MSGSLLVRGHYYSQPTRAVLWLCKQLGINHKFECFALFAVALTVLNTIRYVDLSKGQHRTEEYAEKYDFCKIPVISHDDFHLQESHAIMRYLCDSFRPDGTELYPKDLKERARVDEFLDFHHTNLRLGAGPFVRLTVFGQLSRKGRPLSAEEENRNNVVLSNAAKSLKKSLKVMENRLSRHSFLSGSKEATIADISAFCELRQLILMPFSPPESSFPSVHKWMRGLEEREEAKEVEASLKRLLDKIPRPENNPLASF